MGYILDESVLDEVEPLGGELLFMGSWIYNFVPEGDIFGSDSFDFDAKKLY